MTITTTPCHLTPLRLGKLKKNLTLSRPAGYRAKGIFTYCCGKVYWGQIVLSEVETQHFN